MTPHSHPTPLFANVTICSATLRSSFARGTVVRIRSCSISEVVMFLLITKHPSTHRSIAVRCDVLRPNLRKFTLCFIPTREDYSAQQTLQIVSISLICFIRSPSVSILSFFSLATLRGKTITPSRTTQFPWASSM